MAESKKLSKKTKSPAKLPRKKKAVRQVQGHPLLFGYGDRHGLQLSAQEKVAGPSKGVEPLEGHLFYVGSGASVDEVLGELKKLKGWQASSDRNWYLDRALERGDEIIFLSDRAAPMWIIRPKTKALKAQNAAAHETGKHEPASGARGPGLSSHGGLLAASPYSRARDLCGAWTKEAAALQLGRVTVTFARASDEEVKGAGVGLEMGLYRFPKNDRFKALTLRVYCESDSHCALLHEGKLLGVGVNTARHLVNLPARDLNPKSYSDALAEYFEGSSTLHCEVWGPEHLEREKMGLLLGVGQGAEVAPRMAVLRYRPRQHKGQKRVALVGKGVTFDTGGLDMKGSDNMRLMKKDMGGSAALVGFAVWLQAAEPDFPCDIFLPMAENSIGPKAIRPSDVLRARSGAQVEIHNTDAEGRLVLADAMDVAVRSGDSEHVVAVIDVATLTGAIKVALGTKLAGLFCNYDPLAELILRAGQSHGDGLWRMPLFEDYGEQLRSTFADFSNSASSRFGGAITAALFLQKFAAGKPWAHLDIYAWADRPDGANREEGGSGQGVQCLVGMVERWSQHMSKLS